MMSRLVLPLCALLGLSAPVSAEDGPACSVAAAQQHLRQLAAEAFAIADDPGLDDSAKADRLASLMDQRFNLGFIGSFALGRHLESFDADQLAAFDAVFPRYFVDAYGERIGKIVEASFDIGQGTERRPGDYVVQSSIERAANGEIIDVVWRVRCVGEGEGVSIVDFAARGVSTIVTQRAEFSEVIQSDGIDGLIAELQRRAEDASIDY